MGWWVMLVMLMLTILSDNNWNYLNRIWMMAVEAETYQSIPVWVYVKAQICMISGIKHAAYLFTFYYLYVVYRGWQLVSSVAAGGGVVG
jgi:hypothetical protein